MIGMIAYAILGGFILIAVFISNRLVKIFGWSLSPNKLFLLRVGVFFGIFFILFFDHIIGMIQFEYVCHHKVMARIEPNWVNVQRAWKEDYPIRQKGYVVPIVCTESKYYDMDTKKIFFSYTACRRKGSVLFRKIFDIDLGEKCHPKDLRYILIRLHDANLPEKGKMK